MSATRTLPAPGRSLWDSARARFFYSPGASLVTIARSASLDPIRHAAFTGRV